MKQVKGILITIVAILSLLIGIYEILIAPESGDKKGASYDQVLEFPKKQYPETGKHIANAIQEGVFISSVLTSKLHFFVPSGDYIVTMQAVPLEESSADDLYKVKYELFFEEN
ncbi:competence protein ComJ [Bacillus thuringiensis]